MGIELREAPPDDPVTLRLAEAMPAEVEERGANNGAARPDMELAAKRILEELEHRARRHGQRAIRLDTNTRLVEANRMYLAAGFREIEDYNSNPRSDRWYEKSLA